MTSFSNRLVFTPLSHVLNHLETAATWAEEEWGYILNKGIARRKEILLELKQHTYIGRLENSNQPIAMFVLEPKIIEQFPNAQGLKYVYIHKEYRGLGFSQQLINHAKMLAKESGAELIILITLKPSLNYIPYTNEF